jgi:serine/threonine-protein kinase
MGSVYYGRDVTLDRPVAIKVVNPDVALAPTARARFLAEARTVARLRHPHVVAVHAAGEAGGMLYFVMEYVPGESLRDRLARDGRFDDAEALVVLRDLARALGYAHAQGVVHRDVKPENVLLDAESGRAMLTDFGVAQAVAAQDEGDGRLTGMGVVLGSPRYMSPEQAAGERALDGRSDVYALGLVAYEMFAGEPAVTGSSAPTMLVKHLTEKPAPIETRNARVTPGLAAVIGRALEKDPAQRWEGADAMADALDDLLAAGQGVTGPATGPTRARPEGRRVPTAPTAAAGAAAPAPRRRALLLAGAAAALAAAGGAAWWALGGGSGVPRGVDPRKSFVVAPFEVQSGDPQLTWLHEGSVNMLALNLAQWRDLTVVDYERALDLLRDLGLDDRRRVTAEDAQRLARRAGVWSVVTGVVTGTADSLFVTASLRDVASGRVVDQAQHSAPRSADPRGIFDRIARDLLDVAGAPQTTVALAQSTTASLDAYRAYLDASRALNGWQLARAESLYARATALDSTFALAHYRHAVTLGWSAAGGDEQAAVVRAARRHAARLPQRERALLEAYDDLTAALRAQGAGDSTAENARFVAAQRRYAAVVARDSGDAEAWYGMADALWHHRPGGWASPAAVPNWSRALRAFDRTLRLDSSFHLAYSHKLDIYRVAADPSSPVVLDGDSLRYAGGDLARLGADPAVRQTRRRAADLATREARSWARGRPGAAGVPRPRRAYERRAHGHRGDGARHRAGGEPGAARRDDPLPARAARRPPAAPRRGAGPRCARRSHGDPPRGCATRARETSCPSSSAPRAVAAMGGSTSTVDAVAEVLAEARPTLPGLDLPSRQMIDWWNVSAKLAMGGAAGVGARDARQRDRLRRPPRRDDGPGRAAAVGGAGVRRLPGHARAALPGHAPPLARRQPAALPGDRRAGGAGAARHGARPRARARLPVARLDAHHRPRDERARAGWSARRCWPTWATRAARWRCTRCSIRAASASSGRSTRGYALYARSFLARGRLYEELGDRARAAAAYERFLAFWKDADPALQGQAREARDGLARARDASRAATPVDVRGKS